MPKIKTKKSIKKRFKVTSGGLIIRGHQASRHRRSRKSKRRIRFFAEPKKVTKKQTTTLKAVLNI